MEVCLCHAIRLSATTQSICGSQREDECPWRLRRLVEKENRYNRTLEMLTAGTRLGPYKIISLIGVGGMGEVYRASDPRLGREVAIKVLPELFSSDSGRMARFHR